MTGRAFSFRTFALLSCAALSLSACQTTQTASRDAQARKIDGVLNDVADQAANAGNANGSLAVLENLYKRNSKDFAIAVKYGSALRDAGFLNKAQIVLLPFAKDGGSGNSEAKGEYAAVQAAMGNNKDAEDFARKAILANPGNYNAYQVLGVALDAQGHHPQAEVAFRKALDMWQGNKAPILNNLALALASQGFLDESTSLLHQALEVSNNREDIERNLRIVQALRESGKNLRRPDVPPEKPSVKG
jgi:Flp pilus assembly protein TadD